jgi:large subunit ribosomal protein L35
MYVVKKVVMPKLKTKSSVKKRFKLSASGKVIATQAGKRHGMSKRSNDQIRTQRGTTILADAPGRIVRSYMPYGMRGRLNRKRRVSQVSEAWIHELMQQLGFLSPEGETEATKEGTSEA